jgi:hypothetical protein
VTRDFDRTLLFLLFVFEALLFWTVYHREIAWCPPQYFDQAHYLVRAYELQEDVLEHGLGRLWKAIWNPEHFTGVAFPIEGALFGLIIGGARFPQLCVNLVLFVTLQVAAFYTGRSVWGRRSDSYILLGLILCQGTAWLGAGGLFDFRIDFAAYCLYGVWACLVLRAKLFLDRIQTLVAGVIGTVLIWHRFITTAYVASTLVGFAVACVIIRVLAARDVVLKNRMRQRLENLGLSCAVLAVLAGPILLINSRAIWNYYVVGHVVSEEKYVRASGLGIHDLSGHLLFYPRSIIAEHCGPIFWLAFIFAIGIAAAAHITSRKRPIQPGAPADETFVLQVIFLLGSILSPILILTADISKSPVVGGIVGVPTALLVVVLMNIVWPYQYEGTARLASKLFAGGAILVLAMGILNQLNRASRHAPEFGDQDHLKEVADLEQWLVTRAAEYRWKNPTISLDCISSSLNAPAVTAIGFERTGRLIAFQALLSSSISKRSNEEALRLLEKSDFVILTSPRQARDYPFSQAIETYWSDLKEWSDKHLLVAKTLRFDTYYPYSATVYVRPTAMVRDLSGEWVTSKGMLVEAERADLERYPMIRLKGTADFAKLPKIPEVTATLEPAGESSPLKAKFQRTGDQYEVDIDTSSIRLPADQIVQIRVKFDTFFVRKAAALHNDFRELVVRSPDISLLPAGHNATPTGNE